MKELILSTALFIIRVECVDKAHFPEPKTYYPEAEAVADEDTDWLAEFYQQEYPNCDILILPKVDKA